MKKIIAIALMALLASSWSINATAKKSSKKNCTPTNIAYCKKGKTWTGKKYFTYTVRCSDGTKRTISAWKKKKQWCVGERQRNCSNSQMKTAARACKQG
ncbi:MAG: hypothetical protein GY862_19650 [Gammaproteobacteria bacterium]|nr:hypothetical protein [Gammaproteobacteria bacterium]